MRSRALWSLTSACRRRGSSAAGPRPFRHRFCRRRPSTWTCTSPSHARCPTWSPRPSSCACPSTRSGSRSNCPCPSARWNSTTMPRRSSPRSPSRCAAIRPPAGNSSSTRSRRCACRRSNRESPVILIVDPVTALDTDLRQLHPDLARPVFLQAIRYLRGLVHTSEGSWEAYREGRLLPKEADAVNAALEEHLGIEPEYARLISLGFAHRQDGDWRVKTLTALNRQEEAEMVAAFWQIVPKSLRLQYQLVTYGGARWGIPFILRRTLLHDMTPAASLPVGRARTDIHFDVSEVLANWDRGRVRPLELAAIQYTIPGPWTRRPRKSRS